MSDTATTLRPYRATFILDTREIQEELDQVYTNLDEVLGSLGCTIKSTDKPGQVPFARVTNRHLPSGVYYYVNLEGPTSFAAEVQEKFRLDRRVYRIFVESK